MPSGVSGVPRIVLRVEGAALLLIAVTLYARVGASWWLFAILFLAPDLSFLGYLGGPRTGAIVYNAAHTLVGPLLLALAGLLCPAHVFIPFALIWVAHIGFDRVLGYGLKYAAGFGFTHLGPIGRASDTPQNLDT
jgi:Domain of unknown function (DUF4260)